MGDFKFKVGQRFEIVDKSATTCSGIREYYSRGDVFYVSSIDMEGDAIDDRGLWLEPADVADGSVRLVVKRGFTKDDLKDGMIIENRRGDRRLVLVSKSVFIGDNAYIKFRDYRDDLSNTLSDLDVMKVYDPQLFEGTFTSVLNDAGNIDPPIFDRDNEETRQRDKERLESLEKEVAELREKLGE